MHWTDDGIVLSARPHGESSVVLQLLTRHRGRHAGLVRGGQGKRARGLYQPGNLVAASWSARLADHLGNYTCELVESHAARVLDAPARLAALSAAAAVSESALPEREPHAACCEGFLARVEMRSFMHGVWELMEKMMPGMPTQTFQEGGDLPLLLYGTVDGRVYRAGAIADVGRLSTFFRSGKRAR